MSRLKLDLHDIFNKGKQIDEALNDAIEEAVDRRIAILEIIPGKGDLPVYCNGTHIVKAQGHKNTAHRSKRLRYFAGKQNVRDV